MAFGSLTNRAGSGFMAPRKPSRPEIGRLTQFFGGNGTVGLSMADIEVSTYAEMGREEAELAVIRAHRPRITIKSIGLRNTNIMIDGEHAYSIHHIMGYGFCIFDERACTYDRDTDNRIAYRSDLSDAIATIAWWEGGTVADSI